MLFNSLAYGVFLPVVFLVYWAVPHRYRQIILLLASCYFYMSWNPVYIFLILTTTVVSYSSALLLERREKAREKKWILALSAGVSLGILFFFKYFNFAFASIARILSLVSLRLHPVTLRLLLPVGISFYTFQTLSYVIDVYRGEEQAERNFISYALFVTFFPQLVAGPIERTRNLLPQIKAEHTFAYDEAAYGMKLMTWSFFKKTVVADVLAVYVQRVYDNPLDYRGFVFFLAAILFAIQIYCDFSGYSDIAVGTARLLGIRLMTNFKSPYFSRSIKEFWSRWHISLSQWFRDYVYIPLGGNRVGKLRHCLNLMVTFLISGLWHGADWKFVIWGGIHGLGQILESGLSGPERRPAAKGLRGAVRIGAVFTFCTFAWIFFVSISAWYAMYALRMGFVGIGNPLAYLWKGIADLGISGARAVPILGSLALLFAYDRMSLERDCIQWISEKPAPVRYTVYFLMVTILLFFRAGGETEFVYFQF